MKVFGICSTIVVIGFMVLCLITTKKESELSVELKEGLKEKTELVKEEDNSKVLFKVIREPNNNKWMYRISKVEFEGHTYIVLEDTGTAILHDPDCQCQTQK